MNKYLAAFIWPLLLALVPSAQAFTVTNATNQCFMNGTVVSNGTTWNSGGGEYSCQAGGGFPIMVANGGSGTAYNATIPVGSSGACAQGSAGCGDWWTGNSSNPNQYMTVAQAGANMGQLCAGSGVPPDGSIVYAVSGTSVDTPGKALWAYVYDSSGNTIWGGPLQNDPQNGHNDNKGTVNTNSNGQLQSTWCGANSYN